MSLLFGAATSDRVNCTSNASLDDLADISVLLWVYPTALTANKIYISKYRGTGTTGWQVNIPGASSSDIAFFHGRATTTLAYITNSAPISAINTWYCIAVTLNKAASVAKIYTGSLTAALVEATYGTSQAGVGTYNTDAARSLFVGNVDDATPGTAFTGRIAVAMVWNRVLTLGELTQQQFTPMPNAGCVLFMHLGYNGTGTQPDWSGNSNNGTVTGATVASHVPLGPCFGFDSPYSYVPAAAAAGWGPLLGLGNNRLVVAT